MKTTAIFAICLFITTFATSQNQDEEKEALYKDYNKPGEEVDLTEILVVKREIQFVKRNLYKCNLLYPITLGNVRTLRIF